MYPYIVVRHMPTVYSRIPIRSTGGVGPLRREVIIRRVERIVAEHGTRACAVFGPDDAVYVELDGRRVEGAPGAPVPDGYTHIELPVRGAEPEPAPPTWRTYFRFWDRSAGIWAVRGDIEPVLRATTGRGIERHTSFGGSPGGAGGTDVTAIPFLDGGLHLAWRDGFVCGGLDGTKVVGERALAWCCHVLGVAPPRTCAVQDGRRLGWRVTPDRVDPEAGELLKRARTPEQLVAVARELAGRFEPVRT